MEKKKDKKYDFGCTVIIFLFFIGVTALISYQEGTKKAISDEKKEIMMSKEVKFLEDRLDWNEKWRKEEYNTVREKEILILRRQRLIREEVQALLDTIDSVSINYIKTELDNLKWDVIFIDDFKNLNN